MPLCKGYFSPLSYRRPEQHTENKQLILALSIYTYFTTHKGTLPFLVSLNICCGVTTASTLLTAMGCNVLVNLR